MGRALGEICYARKNGQAYVLDCPDPGAEGGGARPVALMQRSDFFVAFVDLPRGAEEQAREYLSYRVRALYPAAAEETAFDFRLLRSGRESRAVVLATRRDVLERYRALEADLVLPLSLLQSLAPALVAEGGLFVFVAAEWLEALALPGRKWQPEARSLFVQRTASLARDLESAVQGLEAADAPVSVVAPRAQAAEAREALAGGALEGRRATVRQVEGGGRVDKAALFRAEKPSPLPAWSLRIQCLLFLILALATLGYVRAASRERADLAGLEAQLARLRTQAVGAASDRRRSDALSREWAALQARRPLDVYRLLSELTRVLGDEVRVASLIVDGRVFQVEAEGSAALELVARLREDPWFEGVRLLQIVPASGGLERFRLTGAYRAQ